MTPTMIVTRPAAQSTRFVDQIRRVWTQPLHVIQSPLIRIKMLPATMDQVDAVIFTSLNGVAASAQFDLAQGMPAWCVGGRTAKAAQDAGFDAIDCGGCADALVSALLAAQPSGSFAHIRGTHARGNVAVRLDRQGIRCADVVAYDQLACDLTDQAQDALHGKTPVVLPLFSPRTSTILSQQGPFQAPLHIVALSAAVADGVDPLLGATTRLARTPDSAAMEKAVVATLESLAH